MSQELHQQRTCTGADNQDRDNSVNTSIPPTNDEFFNAIEQNDLEWLNTFLNGPLSSLYYEFKHYNKKTDTFATPIMFALTRNHGLPILKLFIEFQNNNDDDESKWFIGGNRNSLLYHAVRSDNVEIIDFVADFFLKSQQQEPTLDQFINKNGSTPLLIAVRHGKLTSVQHLITKYNSDPLVKTLSKYNILHYCAFQNDIKIVDYVMSIEGVPELINDCGEEGDTPILLGVQEGNFDVVKHLIEVYGADISIRDGQDGRSLLHLAVAQHSDLDMIDYVLSKDPSQLEACDNEHITPVLYAAGYGSCNVVKHLIEKQKADLTRLNSDILHFACTNDNDSVDLVDYIISLDPSRVESVDLVGCTPLFYAALHNKPQIFQHLVDNHNVNAHHVTNSDKNLMHYAIPTNNPEMIKLVSKSFESHPEQRYYDRIVGNWCFENDVLRYALERRKLQSMRELIRLKANLSVVGIQFLTLLYRASRLKNKDGTRDYEFVEYLLSDELMKDWCEHDLVENHGLGKDELKLSKNPDPIKTLLEVNMNSTGRSLLLRAGFDLDLHLMKSLINKGANIKAVDLYQHDLLDQVLSLRGGVGNVNDEDGEKQFEILKYLHSTQTIPIPLNKIVLHCPFHIVAYFLNLGFDPCFITALNQNILHIASQNPHSTFLSELINYFIDEHQLSDQIKLWLAGSDKSGKTPLLEFIENRNKNNNKPEEISSTISTLIQHRSNIFHRDVQGMGVLHHICKQIENRDGDDDGDDDIIEDLMQHAITQVDSVTPPFASYMPCTIC